MGGVAASGCVSEPDRRWNHNIHCYPLILAAHLLRRYSLVWGKPAS
jgi:hypothetical protein